MLKRQARQIVGGLSKPSAMPCYGYSLPASECNVGSELRKIQGSICSECYAMKRRYVVERTLDAMHRRLASLDHPLWVEAMVTLIRGMRYFRWHDSGDLQSLTHLRKICDVCEQTPKTKHWLPTRERLIVSQYVKSWPLPSNLIIRLSATMFDQKPAAMDYPILTSGAHKNEPPMGFECRKPYQGNQCGDCRACWSRQVKHVSYAAH